MADIFLSYAREDQEKAEALAKALEEQGWSVFWDLTIPAGESWDTYIGGELEKARCVVVAWSSAGVDSEWVREEAREGRERKILVPVFLEKVKPPFGFRGKQAVDLATWDGSPQSSAFQALVEGLQRILGPASLLRRYQAVTKGMASSRTQTAGEKLVQADSDSRSAEAERGAREDKRRH